MYKLKAAKLYFLSCAITLSFSGCEKEFLTNQETIARTTTSGFKQLEEGIDGYTDLPDGSDVASPTIIKKTFISSNPLNAHTKCLSWKITWPLNQNAMPENKIPTMFATENGALNSFDFLNHADSMNTFKTKFSLYHENRIIESQDTDLWSKLTYLHFYSVGSNYFESTHMRKVNASPATVEGWIKNNPGILENEYLNGDHDYHDNEIEYQAGDMFIFSESIKEKRFGIIRIVSMYPRVIEVYLIVPNNIIRETAS